MSKNKKGAFGKMAPKPRGAFANNSWSRQSSKQEASADYQSKGTPGNMMQELARNTRNQMAHWDQDTRLRDQPVYFTSGGFIEPSNELVCNAPLTRDATKDAICNSKDSETVDSRTPQLTVPQALSESGLEASPSNSKQNKSAVDSDSSGEIILFKGRGSRKNGRRGSRWRGPSRTASTSRPAFLARRPHIGSDDEENTNAAMDDYISNVLFEDMLHTNQQPQANDRELGGFDSGITSGEPYEATQHLPSVHVSEPELDRVSELESNDQFYEDENEDSEGETWGLSATMDDAQLARLLAKQEELGMGGNELLLLDGKSMAGIPRREVGHSKLKASPQSKHTSVPSHAFSKEIETATGFSAEAVADAFERLDMSGWGGSRDGFELNLSDSELEARLRMSWQKDRQRKKEKKLAREELRKMGLLGKNAKPNDPRVKYPDGMHLDDIKTEFHQFLAGSDNSMTFTPMDSHSRKVVHELAHRFNITSKSTGSGDQRRPILSRTKSTVTYDEHIFESIFARTQRRYMPRLDKKLSAGATRRGNAGAAAVRHGEIVGGSAPEIGQQNKGRTMLEKMGWSKGMALGAMDNKGMTQPIEHVVIRSKAGLG